MELLQENKASGSELKSLPKTSGWFAGGEIYQIQGKGAAYHLPWHYEAASIQLGRSNNQYSFFNDKTVQILSKLFLFRNLSFDWDGEGAIPPSSKVISQAFRFIVNILNFQLPLYFTAPGPNGEIIIEFKSNHITAEVYFEEDDFSEMILYKGDEQIFVGPIELNQLISHFQ